MREFISAHLYSHVHFNGPMNWQTECLLLLPSSPCVILANAAGGVDEAIASWSQEGIYVTNRTTIVTGAKGGVGTSTVALNLAVQLAMQTKRRVILMDLARPFGQISLMLDFEPRFTILDAFERVDRLDEPLLASMTLRHKTGVDVLAGPLKAPMKAEQRQSVTIQAILRLIEIADRGYEFVVIDIGVVNAAEWGAVLREGHTILLVAEPSALALGMIEHHMAAANPVGVDSSRIHIIINRWRQNDDGMVAAYENFFSRTVLKRLPNDYRQLTEAVRLGMPLTGSANNPLIARYRDLSAWLATRIDNSGSAIEEAVAKGES
jgi:pilus assembly protein CpaE